MKQPHYWLVVVVELAQLVLHRRCQLMESGSPGGGLPPHAQTSLKQHRLGEKPPVVDRSVR